MQKYGKSDVINVSEGRRRHKKSVHVCVYCLPNISPASQTPPAPPPPPAGLLPVAIYVWRRFQSLLFLSISPSLSPLCQSLPSPLCNCVSPSSLQPHSVRKMSFHWEMFHLSCRKCFFYPKMWRVCVTAGLCVEEMRGACVEMWVQPSEWSLEQQLDQQSVCPSVCVSLRAAPQVSSTFLLMFCPAKSFRNPEMNFNLIKCTCFSMFYYSLLNFPAVWI